MLSGQHPERVKWNFERGAAIEIDGGNFFSDQDRDTKDLTKEQITNRFGLLLTACNFVKDDLPGAEINGKNGLDMLAPPVEVIDVGRTLLKAIYWELNVEGDESDNDRLVAIFRNQLARVELIVEGEYWTERTWELPDGTEATEANIPKEIYDEVTLGDKEPIDAWAEFRFQAKALAVKPPSVE